MRIKNILSRVGLPSANKLVFVFLLVIGGCAAMRHVPSAAEVCQAKASDHWEQLQSAPEQAEEMMALRSGERSIGALLSLVPDKRSEAWFRSGEGAYRYCRYLPKVAVCAAQMTMVDFSLEEGNWKAEGPFETICLGGLGHERL
jgi:hypothetical protein